MAVFRLSVLDLVYTPPLIHCRGARSSRLVLALENRVVSLKAYTSSGGRGVGVAVVVVVVAPVFSYTVLVPISVFLAI